MKIIHFYLVVHFMQWPLNSYRLHKQSECPRVVIKKICPNKNVTFWLYNQFVVDYQLYEVPYPDYDTIIEAPFVKDAPTVFILHGYMKSKSEEPNISLRPPYMTKGYNIISVDYAHVVPGPCYAQAVANSDTIAQCVAFFIVKLLKKTEVKLGNIHVIGFSLGGHIAGRAGVYLRDNDFVLPRLTGLDVAGPLFLGPWTYVNKKSAAFVQVIHTNALWYGKIQPVGHADFFVNKGFVQKLPQCVNSSQNGTLAYMKCSHDMAPQFYAESIITMDKCFCGKASHKEIIMGEYTPPDTRGKFYVETNEKSPFAKDETCKNNTITQTKTQFEYCSNLEANTKCHNFV